MVQEVDQPLALAGARAEMHVREEQRAKPPRPLGRPILVDTDPESHETTMAKSCLSLMTVLDRSR